MIKIFFVSVFFSVAFAFSFSQNRAFSEEYSLTPAQKHFTAIIKSLPGVTSVEWKTPISLWVKASAKAVGSPPKSQVAQQLADILAERGRPALRQPFCIHIYGENTNELAKSCVY